MLFKHKFGKENSLINTRVSSNSVHITIVKLTSFSGHQHFIKTISKILQCQEDIKYLLQIEMMITYKNKCQKWWKGQKIIFCYFMILSSFKIEAGPEPVESIIKQVFDNRLHKRIKIDKSDFNLLSQQPQLRKDYSQSSSFPDQDNKDVIFRQKSSDLVLKRKIICKEIHRGSQNIYQKALHKKYVQYLTNFLHKGNQLLVKRNVPPNLSVLQTIDEGDYINNDQGGFQRKQFPHYSNVIRPQDLPKDAGKVIWQPLFQKIRPQQLIWRSEDNCVLKVKQVIGFIGQIFKRSINFAKKQRRSKQSGQRTKEEPYNHDFQDIAMTLGIHPQTSKLLYDLLNAFYSLDQEMERGEQSKIKAKSQIRDSLRQILQPLSNNTSIHVPHQQQYLSLRDLRILLHDTLARQQH